MANSTYQVSELDERTRQYLTEVRNSSGKDMAGIFMSNGAPAAAWGFPLTGVILLGIVLYLVIPPLNNPTHQAMLLTAGLLLCGWMMLAGVRLAIAQIQGRTLGVFIYADPRQIWSVDYSVVQRWPLKNLQGCRVNGATLSLEYPDGVETVQVPFEVGILEIAAYLEYWLQARGDGPHDQALIDAHAAAARAAAYDEDVSDQPDFSTEIPVPKPDEGAGKSRDWPILLAICVFGIGLYFAVHWFILVWHDLSVYNFVRAKSPTHWRAYLLDHRNTMYREKVQQMLRERYQQKADQLKAQVLAKNEPGFQGSEAAMEQLLQSLAEAPQPIVTMRIQDKTDHANQQQNPNIVAFDPAQLQNTAQTEITDAIYESVGQDLISLIRPPDDFTPLLDIRFKFVRDGNIQRLDWELEVRKSPDSDPHYKASWRSDVPAHLRASDVLSNDIRRIRGALLGT